MKIVWIGAAGVSVVAHVAFAAWVDTREPAPPVKRPATVMRFVPAKPKPKLVEPPPPPPPPPVAPARPRIVHAVKRAPAPVAPVPKAGIDADASASGDFATAAGPDLAAPVGGEVDHAPPAPPPPPAPPAPRGKRFVPEFKVTRLPTAKTPIHPELPAALRNAQRELHVTVEVEIDEAGRVIHVRVLGPAEPGLDTAVISAVERTEFTPALVGTQPVAVRYHIPFTFRVHG
ncbi:MAG TPA: energy transducer TonB [Kofleriaceae bacterium]|nr:energy transducer TonB [Kofleriaceae bacterium]